jgi:hypothetical protein
MELSNFFSSGKDFEGERTVLIRSIGAWAFKILVASVVLSACKTCEKLLGPEIADLSMADRIAGGDRNAFNKGEPGSKFSVDPPFDLVNYRYFTESFEWDFFRLRIVDM